MSHPLRSSVAIVAHSMALARRGEGERKTPLQLGAQAAADALRKAGIGRHRVGALFTGRTPMSYMVLQYNQALLSELKIAPTFSSEVTAHGAGALGTLQLAALALQAGVIDYALCVTNEASGIWMDQFSANAGWESELQFEAPYGPTTPSLYAQFACRYMHELEITEDQCARVAVENRKWALHHPQAAMYGKGEITVEDVLSSPMIASPLHKLDCAIWYPGGIATAVVLTRADMAANHHDKFVYLAGFGQCSTHEWVSERVNSSRWRNLTETGARVAAQQAYEMAGLKAHDMDIVETSAPFTFANLMMLEDLGFCGRGEAGGFVADGGIDFEGGLPFNTTGGYLSFGQVAQGLYNLHEVIDQMWGQAPGRPVKDVEVGLVHGHGGPLACHSVVIVSKERLQ